MRIDFISRLALLLLAGFLVIATQVWAMGTVEWLFIVGGILMIALAAGSLAQPAGPQRTLDAFLALATSRDVNDLVKAQFFVPAVE